jgi:hypothetical protein
MRFVLPSAAIAAAAGIALSAYGFMAPTYVQPPAPSANQAQVVTAQPVDSGATFAARTRPARGRDTTVTTVPDRATVTSRTKHPVVSTPRRSSHLRFRAGSRAKAQWHRRRRAAHRTDLVPSLVVQRRPGAGAAGFSGDSRACGLGHRRRSSRRLLQGRRPPARRTYYRYFG